MRPVLVELWGVPLYSYGAALFAAALVCGGLAWLRRPPGFMDLNRYLDLCIVTILAAIVGARAFYWLTEGAAGGDSPASILRFWQAGRMSSLGLVVLTGPLLALYLRIRKVPALATFDHLFPYAFLAAAIQRGFGCFLAGCCPGKPTTLPWGVVPPGSPGVALHPVQLYLGAGFLAAFPLLLRVSPSPAGRRSVAALGCYFLLSLAMEPFRGGTGTDPGSLQPLHLVLGAVCAGLYLWTGRPTLSDPVKGAP